MLLFNVVAFSHDVAKQQRLDKFLAQKSLHIIALLVDVATTLIKLAMLTTTLKNKITNSSNSNNDVNELLNLIEKMIEIRQKIKKRLEKYVLS